MESDKEVLLNKGVKKWDSLRILLFIIIVDGLLKYIREKTIFKLNVKQDSLLYTDDIVLWQTPREICNNC